MSESPTSAKSGASWLPRALAISALLHALAWGVGAVASSGVWRRRHVETVDIELAPVAPKAETLPQEKAPLPEPEAVAAATAKRGKPEEPEQKADGVAYAIDAGPDAAPDAMEEAMADAMPDAPPKKKKKKPKPDAGPDAGADAGLDDGGPADAATDAATDHPPTPRLHFLMDVLLARWIAAAVPAPSAREDTRAAARGGRALPSWHVVVIYFAASCREDTGGGPGWHCGQK